MLTIPEQRNVSFASYFYMSLLLCTWPAVRWSFAWLSEVCWWPFPGWDRKDSNDRSRNQEKPTWRIFQRSRYPAWREVFVPSKPHCAVYCIGWVLTIHFTVVHGLLASRGRDWRHWRSPERPVIWGGCRPWRHNKRSALDRCQPLFDCNWTPAVCQLATGFPLWTYWKTAFKDINIFNLLYK